MGMQVTPRVQVILEQGFIEHDEHSNGKKRKQGSYRDHGRWETTLEKKKKKDTD
jgi:ribulose bisphosphate carboxylase small subunit